MKASSVDVSRNNSGKRYHDKDTPHAQLLRATSIEYNHQQRVGVLEKIGISHTFSKLPTHDFTAYTRDREMATLLESKTANTDPKITSKATDTSHLHVGDQVRVLRMTNSRLLRAIQLREWSLLRLTKNQAAERAKPGESVEEARKSMRVANVILEKLLMESDLATMREFNIFTELYDKMYPPGSILRSRMEDEVRHCTVLSYRKEKLCTLFELQMNKSNALFGRKAGFFVKAFLAILALSRGHSMTGRAASNLIKKGMQGSIQVLYQFLSMREKFLNIAMGNDQHQKNRKPLGEHDDAAADNIDAEKTSFVGKFDPSGNAAGSTTLQNIHWEVVVIWHQKFSPGTDFKIPEIDPARLNGTFFSLGAYNAPFSLVSSSPTVSILNRIQHPPNATPTIAATQLIPTTTTVVAAGGQTPTVTTKLHKLPLEEVPNHSFTPQPLPTAATAASVPGVAGDTPNPTELHCSCCCSILITNETDDLGNEIIDLAKDWEKKAMEEQEQSEHQTFAEFLYTDVNTDENTNAQDTNNDTHAIPVAPVVPVLCEECECAEYESMMLQFSQTMGRRPSKNKSKAERDYGGKLGGRTTQNPPKPPSTKVVVRVMDKGNAKLDDFASVIRAKEETKKRDQKSCKDRAVHHFTREAQVIDDPEGDNSMIGKCS